ncbi:MULTISPECIES: hypothetical protein [unclassified Lentimonas]|uniref:hypothetical protein n=1 Tax=unclassified Lentimonas TaxID=2630993 RepID=UPI0013296006|nr:MULTISPECIES: hypothetical protein [unclassified Lentimonas]CAA6691597.1 Unannotated [Lentimonas sp. CC19]CAA6692230.1 Unannotated [Lentimonas sp. CC10]CAA7070172.1 Unannotated [Lentimonas sp. CC11]
MNTNAIPLIAVSAVAVLSFSATTSAGTHVSTGPTVSTDYKTGSITFVSATQTLGRATFNISYDVLATSVDDSPNVHSDPSGVWGIYSPESDANPAHGVTFDGDQEEAATLGNLRVTSFSDGGGDLTSDDIALSFHSVVVSIAHHNPDRVGVSVNGSEPIVLGRQDEESSTVVLADVVGATSPVGSFGLFSFFNLNKANRWAVSDVVVHYTDIPEPRAYALLAGLLGLSCVLVRRRRVN